ncbi:hypothetical protein CYMTET_51056, partial [Cymbomonas tetramitiformis]
YKGTYASTIAGVHELLVTYEGGQTRHLAQSEGDATVVLQMQLTVAPATANAAQSSPLVFPPDPSWRAREEGRFELVVRDEYSNVRNASDDVRELQVTLGTASNGTLVVSGAQVSVEDTADGSWVYVIVFEPQQAGTAFVQLELGGEALLDPETRHPYSEPVASAPTSAAHTTYSGSGVEAGAYAGTTATFTVQLRDELGNPVDAELEEDSELTVVFTPAEGSSVEFEYEVTYVGNGQYVVSYTPTSTDGADEGPWGFSIAVAIDAEPVGTAAGATGTETVQAYSPSNPAELSVSQSRMVAWAEGQPGEELSSPVERGAVAGESWRCFVQLRDVNGVDYPEIPSGTTLTVTGAGVPANLVTYVDGLGSGRWEVEVEKPSVAGSLVLYASIAKTDGAEAEAVGNSPVEVVVHSAAASAEVSSLGTGEGLVSGTAGVRASFTILAYDEFSNEAEYSDVEGAEPFIVVLSFAGTSEVVYGTVTKAPGDEHTYEAVYTSMLAGDATLSVTLDGALVGSRNLTLDNGVLDLYLASLEVDPEMVASALSVDKRHQLEVQARDLYGNQHVDPELQFNLLVDPSRDLSAAGVQGIYGVVTFAELSYLGDFFGEVAGDYTVLVKELTQGKNGLVEGPGTPLNVVFAAGAVDAERSTVTGECATSRAASGAACDLAVHVCDRYGNALTLYAGDAPEVRVEGTLLDGYDGPNTTEATDVSQRTDSEGTVVYNMTLVMSQPGEYDLSVMLEGSEVTGTVVVVAVLPAAAPVVMECMLDDTLGRVWISFDQATDEGQLQSPFDCSSVLQAGSVTLLGADAYCAWEYRSAADEYSSLAVYMGFGANLTVETAYTSASRLFFVDGIVRNALRNSYGVSGTGGHVVQVPPSPTPVVASLVAPSVIGVCDGFTLDASGSVGDGGRALKYYFSVLSHDDTTRCAAKLSLDEENLASAVLLEPSDMEGGASYTFKVVVINWVGVEAAAETTVSVSSIPVLQVDIQGAPYTTTKSSQQVSLFGLATHPSYDCVENSETTLSVLYQWRQLSGATSVSFTVDPMFSTSASGNFVIAPGTMLIGENYTFRVTAYMEDQSTEPASADIIVFIESEAIVVDGALGADRTHRSDEDLALEANPSDPANAIDRYGNPTAWSYAWSCVGACPVDDATGEYDTTGSTCTPCFDDSASVNALLQNAARVTVASGAMVAGTVYLFECAISKEPLDDDRQNVVSSVAVEVLDPDTGLTVAVEVEGVADASLSPGEGVTLAASVKGAAAPTYAWSLVEGPALDLAEIVVVQYGETLLTEARLSLDGSKLVAGQQYTLRCDASEEQRSGYAMLTLRVSSGPYAGDVLVYYLPENGTDTLAWIEVSGLAGMMDADGDGMSDTVSEDFIALTSKFTVEATGWAAEDLPLSYSYMYSVASTDGYLAPRTSDCRYETRLPSGEEVQGGPAEVYVLEVKVTVTDARGASVEKLYPLKLDVDPLNTAQASSSRRHLAQTTTEGLTLEDLTAGQAARIAKELVFDEAAGRQDVNTMTLFLDIWGQFFGRFGQTYYAHGACELADQEVTALKTELIEAVIAQDLLCVLTTEWVQMSICAISHVTADPGELTAETQAMVLTMARHSKLIPVLENYYMYNLGYATEQVVLGNSGQCFADLINDLLRSTEARCNGTDMLAERNQTRMDELYDTVEDLGVSMAQQLVAGATADELTGQYVTLAAQRSTRRQANSDLDQNTRRSDVEGTLMSDGSELFNFLADVTTEAACTEDTDVVCGDALGAGDLFDAVYYSYHTSDDTSALDFIDPLPAVAQEDSRRYGEIAGLFLEYLNLTEYAALLEASEKEGSTHSTLYAHGQRLTAEATIDLRDVVTPEGSSASMTAGVRYWDSLEWTREGVQDLDEGSLKAVVANIQPAVAFSPYLEEAPSPPPIPPIPSPPQIIEPVLLSPPPPIALESTQRELTVGIVIAPVVAGVSLCSYIIFVFYRRRRAIQEMHIDEGTSGDASPARITAQPREAETETGTPRNRV